MTNVLHVESPLVAESMVLEFSDFLRLQDTKW